MVSLNLLFENLCQISMEAAGCRVVQGRFCKGQYTQIRAAEHRCMYKQGVRTLEHQIIDSVTRFCKAHHVNTKEDIYRISAISVSPSTVYTGG